MALVPGCSADQDLALDGGAASSRPTGTATVETTSPSGSVPAIDDGGDETGTPLARTAVCDAVPVAEVAVRSTLPVGRSFPDLYGDERPGTGVVRCQYPYAVGSPSVGFVSIGVNPNGSLDDVERAAGADAQPVTVEGMPGLFSEGRFRNGLLKVAIPQGLLEIEIRGTIGPPSPTEPGPYIAVAELAIENLDLR